MAARRSEHEGRVSTALAVVGCLSVMACGGGGDGASAGVDSQGSAWYLVIPDLDEGMFAATFDSSGEALVVGGSATRGLVLSFVQGPNEVWHESMLPDGTPRLRAIWSSATAGTFIAGDAAAILRREDGRWMQQIVDVPPDTQFHGIWGSGPDDVWVVGGRPSGGESAGVIVHWDGVNWARATEPAASVVVFRAVWGADPTHLFVAGDHGTILRGDGSTWARERTETDEPLAAIWGPNSDEVLCVGGAEGSEGVVLRRDGGDSWRESYRGPNALHTIVGLAGGGFFVGGEEGFVGAFGSEADDFGFQRSDKVADVAFLGGAVDSGSARRLLVGGDLSQAEPTRGLVATSHWLPSGEVVRFGEPVP